MSFQAVAWAWHIAVDSPVERCALLWLANWADTGGLATNVDMEALQAFCGADRETVAAALQKLDERRIVISTDREGELYVGLPISLEFLAYGQVNSAPVATSVRSEVLVAHGYRCFACGSDDNLHVDHIIPRKKGGSNDRENLQGAQP